MSENKHSSKDSVDMVQGVSEDMEKTLQGNEEEVTARRKKPELGGSGPHVTLPGMPSPGKSALPSYPGRPAPVNSVARTTPGKNGAGVGPIAGGEESSGKGIHIKPMALGEKNPVRPGAQGLPKLPVKRSGPVGGGSTPNAAKPGSTGHAPILPAPVGGGSTPNAAKPGSTGHAPILPAPVGGGSTPNAATTAGQVAHNDIELPEAWLNGGDVPFERETPFSVPQTIPLDTEGECTPSQESPNVHLEKNENLPEVLEDIIAGYDDEIVHVRTRDGARECTIQLAIARILEHTGYEKLAYVRYLKALEANHFSRTAIHELRRIARAYNKTKDVVTLLQSALDTAVSAEEQSILLEECGLIVFFGDPPNPTDGIAMLYRAIALSPKRISPLCTLLQMFLFERRYEDCCEILEKLLGLTDDHQAQVLCHTMLGDIRSSLNPGADAGLNSYLQVLTLEPDSLYAFQHAMGVLLRQKSWQLFYDNTLSFAKNTKDKTISHAALLVAGAVAFDLLSDSDASSEAYELSMQYRPGDSLALELLLDNYSGDPAQWRQLDGVIERLVPFAETPREKLDLLIMRAINLDVNGHDPAMAIQILDEVCGEGKATPFLLNYYCDLLKRNDQIEEAMRITKKAAEQLHTEEAADRFANLGCYCLEILKKNDDAEECFRMALSFNPNQRTAFENLELILRARNDFVGLAKLYLARLDVVMDARVRASILYSLATICEYSLGQYENAILYYRQYREIYPDDIHAIHNLERLYMRFKDWKNLIELYLIEKSTAPTPAARCEILVRIANICRYKLNKPHYTISFLNQAKKENPKSVLVYRELLDVLYQAQIWRTYIDVSRELLAIQKKDADKVMTLLQMAKVYEIMLCDNSAAVQCLEQVLALDPDNAVAYVRLLAIYQASGNCAAYYELTLDRAQRMPESKARTNLLFKVGLKTFSLFRETEQAISIFEDSLQGGVGYIPSVFILSLLYACNAQIPQLVHLLQEATGSLKNQASKSASSITQAYLRTWILHEAEEAIHPLELALALTPDATSAGLMLLMNQYARGQFGELSALYTERAQNTTDRDFAVFFYNMAAFTAHRYPEKPGAIDNEIIALRAALELDPDNVIANERLEALEPCRVNLVPFLEKRLKYAPIEDKIELQLAIVESTFAESPQQAFAMVCQIVDENPSHLPAVRVATNMAAKLNNTSLWCRFLAIQAQNLENITMRIIAWTNAATVARDKLNQPDLAIEYFKQAFMLAPQQMECYVQLLELLKKKHDIVAIDGILQIHTHSISRENQVMRYREMADIYLNEFNEPVQAIVKLKQVLEVEHDNVEVLMKLAQLEIGEKHYSEARTALENILDIKDADPVILAQAREKLLDLYIDVFGTYEHAIPLLQDTLASNPNDTEAMERMANVYFAQSRMSESLALFLRLNTLVHGTDKVRVLLQIASLYKALNQNDKIGDIMHEAAELAKTLPEALDIITPWIERCKDPSIVLAFVEKLVENADLPTKMQVAIYEFAAKTYAGTLHMRFEADKFAMAAANLAPDSFRAQILAAHVFSPKDAMVYATNAARLEPFNPESYRVMCDIASNSDRFDLQARVEQQLEIVSPGFTPTEAIQRAFIERFPRAPGLIDESVVRQIAPQDFNFYIQKLLSMAEGAIQIFDPPVLEFVPQSQAPSLCALIAECAVPLSMTGFETHFVQDAPFIYTTIDMRQIVFNLAALAHASEAERRFHVASAFIHAKMGTLPLILYPSENVVALVSGLLGLYDSKLTTHAILSRMKSIIPRATRRVICDFIDQNSLDVFQYDPARLQGATATLDAYIGHLFSLDLKSSVAAILRRRKPNTTVPNNLHQWLLAHPSLPQIQELLEFNISERFSAVRQRLGLFLKVAEPV